MIVVFYIFNITEKSFNKKIEAQDNTVEKVLIEFIFTLSDTWTLYFMYWKYIYSSNVIVKDCWKRKFESHHETQFFHFAIFGQQDLKTMLCFRRSTD